MKIYIDAHIINIFREEIKNVVQSYCIKEMWLSWIVCFLVQLYFTWWYWFQAVCYNITDELNPNSLNGPETFLRKD
jgi:hypothetical protein